LGENSDLCPTEAFASLVKGGGGRDRAKNNSFLKILFGALLIKINFLRGRGRKDGFPAVQARKTD